MRDHSLFYIEHLIYLNHIQDWAKEWSLGCVNLCPAARGSQKAGFTQPRDHSFAQPCIGIGNVTCFTRLKWMGLGICSPHIISMYVREWVCPS